jgi:hypothetical protein
VGRSGHSVGNIPNLMRDCRSMAGHIKISLYG